MMNVIKRYAASLFCIASFLWMLACGRPVTTPDGGMGIPIKLANADYALDIFYENQPTDRVYKALGPVKVEKEVPLNQQQTKDGRMLYRGNNEKQKKALLDQLVLQGISLGAHALVNVKYKYYTGKDYQGFVMEGIAVKYGN